MQDVNTLSGTRSAVAEAVRVAMARRQINQVRLAELTGMKQQYISRRLRGETAFDTDDLDAIASALGVTVVDLVTVPAAAAA